MLQKLRFTPSSVLVRALLPGPVEHLLQHLGTDHIPIASGRMIFTGTSLRGAFLVDPQPHLDERGSFARTWCQREFEAHGLEPVVVQCSSVVSAQAGTLRGMHYQCAPHEEAKLVRCVRGSIFEVILDLRLGSPTFAKHYAVVLSAANRRMLYVPKGFAQGYQTLEPDTEVLYQMSDFHAPAYARGVRWNDPAFAICWPPATRRIISARDQQYPDFDRRVQVEQSYRIASRG